MTHKFYIVWPASGNIFLVTSSDDGFCKSRVMEAVNQGFKVIERHVGREGVERDVATYWKTDNGELVREDLVH